MRADGSVETIASTSQAANRFSEGSAPLHSTGGKKTSRALKPPVKSKGVAVPSSLDKENEVKTIANHLFQKKNVRLMGLPYRFLARVLSVLRNRGA